MAQKQKFRWIRGGQGFYYVGEDKKPVGAVYSIEGRYWICCDCRRGRSRALAGRFADVNIARIVLETLVKAGLQPVIRLEQKRQRFRV